MSTPIDGSGSSPTAVAVDRGFFGHPRGLSTLFFTEMWERFSYYGMRALLTLYMTSKLADGGLGFDEKYASVIYATYVSSVWYLPLVGGWLADRIFGARRAVLIGGVIIACGHYSMAVNSIPSFYAGLILIALGTGLLKPNISAMVGQLYADKDERRDAGFSIFYMGINLGAFISPIICGWIGERRSWRLGFVASAVGMVAGLIQYMLNRNWLGAAGLHPASTGDLERDRKQKRLGSLAVAAFLVAIIVPAALASQGVFTITAEQISNGLGWILIALAAVVFAWMILGK